MIVLDTNVVSAVTGRLPDPMIGAWLDTLRPEDVFITSIGVQELRFGIESHRDAVFRVRMRVRLDWFLTEILEDRVLPFDTRAAEETAILAAKLKKAGRPTGAYDVQIAGICIATGAVLATRNIRHFVDAGIPLFNPWAP